ncbi:hypothetical protein BV22DRAFT_162244 [Leucogyrophana mollusca]|uniref:Uncharacterized protein n=1 Tax=Leucogyrophana mollusca TaxID=85980 RepID=A0ACB8BUF2_9AGAM|nr:hypothetical protein BV22DRAFT_162244 [Leucogyrophana mollusca]
MPRRNDDQYIGLEDSESSVRSTSGCRRQLRTYLQHQSHAIQVFFSASILLLTIPFPVEGAPSRLFAIPARRHRGGRYQGHLGGRADQPVTFTPTTMLRTDGSHTHHLNCTASSQACPWIPYQR